MDQGNNNNGTDLSQYLGGSAIKSQGGQLSSEPDVSSHAPKIIRWLFKYSGGLIKNERQAVYVLLGFMVFVIIISLFLIFGGGNKESSESFAPPAEAPAEEVISSPL